MDRLSTLLSQFGVRANLFYYGKLCGMASYDGADPRGHIHLLQAGTVTLQGLDRKDLLLTQPSLIFLPRPSRHRVEAQFDIKPDRLIGDTAYGTAPMLAWMVEEKDIEPHVPVWDKTERKNDSFSSNDFRWNEEAEEYLCPAGNALRSEWRAFKTERSHVTKANTIIFRSRQTDCTTCPMKAKCCPNTAFRKIARSIHEAARDVARRIAAAPEYVRTRHERKKVEMLFAHLKRILKLDRLRLRGMSGATDEFTLAAAVQNLRRLAKLTTQGPPATG
ncbi:transposase [Pseudomonas sp. ZB1P45]|uniref:transposase n=1 Tax=Pseudomonas frigoris TaxID=3398356 RepID=UPI0039EE6FD0